jgi:hypothetical protein
MALQEEPIQAGAGEAAASDQVAGLVQQMRADYLLGSIPDARSGLEQRLSDAGIVLNGDEFERALSSITG